MLEVQEGKNKHLSSFLAQILGSAAQYPFSEPLVM
jgi:hypothetical protein